MDPVLKVWTVPERKKFVTEAIIYWRSCKRIPVYVTYTTSTCYFMLSGRISRNIGENIFRSYTGNTSENTDFRVLVA